MSEIQRWLYQGMATGMSEAHTSGLNIALLLLAFVFGCLHALMPGHGKSVLVSYHLGLPTRVTNALLNGSLLVSAHVGSAILIVLGGLAVVRVSLGPAPHVRYMETASALFIIAIGCWMWWRAFRPHRHNVASGPTLAFVTGLVPCPLTTFIMTYAVVNKVIALGLAVVCTMALGMIATIAGFAVAAVVTRNRFVLFLDRSEVWRARLTRGLETASAIGVIVLGGTLLYKNF